MYDIEKFFDEMNVLKPEKERRIKTANLIDDAMRDFFASQIIDVEEGIYPERSKKGYYTDLLIDLYFTFLPEKERYSDEFEGKAGEFAQNIQNTTDKAVLGNTDKQKGSGSKNAQEKPDGTNAVSDAQKKTVFSDNRARLISLNESLQIWNTIRHKELKGKQATHTWQSMEDDRVRPTHAEADGQTVPIEEPFKVGKYLLMYPGDSSLGAGEEEIILCRCYEL